VPLIELEARVAKQPILLDRVRAIREQVLNDVVLAQSDWHSWTWRNARRLDVALPMLGPNLKGAEPAQGRNCDGSVIFVPDPEPSASYAPETAPLTSEPR
jgi:hypothetical protein